MHCLIADGTQPDYYLDVQRITSTSKNRDLDLTFIDRSGTKKYHHVDVTKAYATLRQIRRRLGILTPDLSLTIFTTYIRPLLETTILSPFPTLEINLDLLEIFER